MPRPKFVFAHILAPHPPFIFGENGEAAKHGDCNGLDGSLFKGTAEDYRNGYPKQMAYISKKIQEAVDEILAKSNPPPIIIIQGDHGSSMLLDWESPKNSCLRERTSILNAYYIRKRTKYTRQLDTVARISTKSQFGPRSMKIPQSI